MKKDILFNAFTRIEFYKLAAKHIKENIKKNIPSHICTELIEIARLLNYNIRITDVLKHFPELRQYAPETHSTVYAKWFFDIPYKLRDEHRIFILGRIVFKMEEDQLNNLKKKYAK